MKEKSFEKYHDLEEYLFGEVSKNFEKNGFLTADEFFCIIIWKANRVKSKIAQKFGKESPLDEAISKLTRAIYQARTNKEKLRILICGDYGFYLPTASAILSVLYPDDFSVYDYRVCDILKECLKTDKYHKIKYWIFERLWDGYLDYLNQVKLISGKKNFRDADKYLWGKSFYTQLQKDIKNHFERNEN